MGTQLRKEVAKWSLVPERYARGEVRQGREVRTISNMLAVEFLSRARNAKSRDSENFEQKLKKLQCSGLCVGEVDVTESHEIPG